MTGESWELLRLRSETLELRRNLPPLLMTLYISQLVVNDPENASNSHDCLQRGFRQNQHNLCKIQ